MNVIDFITACKLTVKALLIETPYQLAPPPSKHRIKEKSKWTHDLKINIARSQMANKRLLSKTVLLIKI